MSEENFKEIINKRFNEKMEIEYALKFNFDEIVKKIINVKDKDEEFKILQKIIEKQQEEIKELKEKQDYARLEKEQLLEDGISKDTIREKLEEVKNRREAEIKKYQVSMLGSAIDILQELLEE